MLRRESPKYWRAARRWGALAIGAACAALPSACAKPTEQSATAISRPPEQVVIATVDAAQSPTGETRGVQATGAPTADPSPADPPPVAAPSDPVRSTSLAAPTKLAPSETMPAAPGSTPPAPVEKDQSDGGIDPSIEGDYEVMYVRTNANLRSGPSSDAARLRTLAKGTEVIVVASVWGWSAEQGEEVPWSELQTGGWIRSDLLDEYSGTSDAAGGTIRCFWGGDNLMTSADALLYSTRGADATVRGSAPAGRIVQVTGEYGSYQCDLIEVTVYHEGEPETGFVPADELIDAGAAYNADRCDLAPEGSQLQVKCLGGFKYWSDDKVAKWQTNPINDFTNLMSDPSADDAINLIAIPKGDLVKLGPISEPDNEWFGVEYEGRQGWVPVWSIAGIAG